jgi:hypothetical protein
VLTIYIFGFFGGFSILLILSRRCIMKKHWFFIICLACLLMACGTGPRLQVYSPHMDQLESDQGKLLHELDFNPLRWGDSEFQRKLTESAIDSGACDCKEGGDKND